MKIHVANQCIYRNMRRRDGQRCYYNRIISPYGGRSIFTSRNEDLCGEFDRRRTIEMKDQSSWFRCYHWWLRKIVVIQVVNKNDCDEPMKKIRGVWCGFCVNQESKLTNSVNIPLQNLKGVSGIQKMGCTCKVITQKPKSLRLERCNLQEWMELYICVACDRAYIREAIKIALMNAAWNARPLDWFKIL